MKIARIALLVTGLIVAGFHLGTGHAQRYATKDLIPGSKVDDVPLDFDLWKYLDSEKADATTPRHLRFDAQWREKIKDDLIRSKPSLRAIAEQKRQAARKVLYARLTELTVGKTTLSD